MQPTCNQDIFKPGLIATIVFDALSRSNQPYETP